MVRSLFGKVTAWFFITLALSFLGFFATAQFRRPPDFNARSPWDAANRLKLEVVLRAWDEHGLDGLSAALRHLDEMFGQRHVLLSASNRDVLTGQDRSELGQEAQRMPIQMVRSADGRYALFSSLPPPPSFVMLWPYLLLIAVLIGVMSWIFTLHLVSPLRQLRTTVREFGAGNLTLRALSTRRDELGDLGRDFDLMADRIETLLTSERRLLQDVSHELRTPLARLVLAIELKRPEQTHTEIIRLTSLIGELFEMTRAEGGMAKLERERVDASALLEEVATRYNIAPDIAAGLVCYGSQSLLGRALENVLQNALRYSPEGRLPTLSASRVDDCLVIRIRDFGPGAPDDAIADLFRPFYRAASATTSDGGGVGLGLAIAQRAVRLHRGDISAKNVYPGLEVTVTLPV
jgi:two-component system sensor histidine kinase CpxA